MATASSVNSLALDARSVNTGICDYYAGKRQAWLLLAGTAETSKGTDKVQALKSHKRDVLDIASLCAVGSELSLSGWAQKQAAPIRHKLFAQGLD